MQTTALYKALGLAFGALLVTACASKGDMEEGAGSSMTATEQQANEAADDAATRGVETASLSGEALQAEANAAQVTEIKTSVEAFSKSVDDRISELAEKHSALSAAVTEIKGTIDGVQKRVDAVEGDTAIKKSSDLGGSAVQAVNKSKWNGSFLGSVNEIFN